MEIGYLADHKEHVKKVTHWLFREWGEYHPYDSEEEHLKRIKVRLNKRKIPTIFAAVEQGKPVGTASLIKHDMDTHMHYSPWLASLYVPPQERRKGIGTALAKRVEEEARLIGKKNLYLFTPDMESFYTRINWKTIERAEYRDGIVCIMVRKLE